MTDGLRKTSNWQENQKTSGPVQAIRFFLMIALAANWVVVILMMFEDYGLGSILGFSGSRLLSLWPFFLYIAILTFFLFLTNSQWFEVLLRFSSAIIGAISRLGVINWFLAGVPILVFGFYHLVGWELTVIDNLPKIWVFAHVSLVGGVFLIATGKADTGKGLLAIFSVYGVILWAIYYIPNVHTYPLSMGWSETSRYYYASLYLSPVIYGQRVALSSLHPSRYLMQAVPFLLPSLPLWFHRLWQVILWVALGLAGGYGLVKRIKPADRLIGISLAAWFFLFIFQGPVYYHLMVVIIIVLFGFDKERLGRSLGFVMLASLWAGISRVNWFPIPGMLVVTLYVLEIPAGKKSFWQYWRWPIMTVLLGFFLAFVSQAGFAAISGKPPDVFVSSFQSPLYRYRLFPNEAFGPGIINMLITVTFPVWVVLIWRILPRVRAWRFFRLLALVSILVTLLAMGLIVSMKIGGGNNLHNLDAYLVFLAVIGAYVAFNRFSPDRPDRLPAWTVPAPLLVFVFLIPTIFVLDLIRPYPDLENERAWEHINQIQDLINERVVEGGEVLFIQNRHLLTFDMIEGVTLVPEYEKVFLMEMVMSGNQAYLEQFWFDLDMHRFDLIVTEPLSLAIKPFTEPFAEENNYWVERVGWPMMDSYNTILDLYESGMWVMAPKTGQSLP